MQVKKYQNDVLSDLREYTAKVAETGNPATAFKEFWEDRPLPDEDFENYDHYNDTMPGVPRVTAKVPTAGGKTFIACNALREIIENYIPSMDPKVIVWFVPSEAILTQTYANLSNPSHPYRHVINSHFSGSVEVYSKETLLYSGTFKPESISSQLSILVLEIQSFASKTRDLRSYKDNENLYSFEKSLRNEEKIEAAEDFSLINVIASLHPIVIVDESHNFQGQLRLDTLALIKPKFVFELTATPRESSNVISYITAKELKAENMVKLPVIVSNRKTVDDVLYTAYNLRKHLEELAQNEDDYVRPIVLFQAEPRTASETVTFDKLKEKLIEIGIPEEEIAIKVSGRDELKNVDLKGPDCKIRYIITVNALKEGWDCPFAYVLASIANRNSRIDVEQILGRVLRLPYAKKRKSKELGMAYVLTSSAKFEETLDSIVHAMNSSGFSRKDVREQEPEPVPTSQGGAAEETLNLELCNGDEQVEAGPASSSSTRSTSLLDDIDTAKIAEQMNDTKAGKAAVVEIVKQALEQNASYEKEISNRTNNTNDSQQSMDSKYYQIKKAYRPIISELRLPKLYVKVHSKNIFMEEEDQELSFKYLLKDFDLTMQDKEISFSDVSYEARQIDVSENGAATISSISAGTMQYLNEMFKGLSNVGKKQQLERDITSRLKKFDSIAEGELKKYISDILSPKSDEELITLQENFPNTLKCFSTKLETVCTEYAKKRFIQLKDSNRIFAKNTYSFPTMNNVQNPLRGLDGNLFIEEEDNLNTLERKVIMAISTLDNVIFWHRNPVRGVGFGIRGFIPNGHYPDFIIYLESGVTVMIESKGEVYTNYDSANKLDLGNYWSALSDSSKFKYFMVYETNGIPGAKTLNELLDILKQL